MSTENVGSDINPYDDGEAGRQNYLNLHSDQSLLLIWKFRTKPKKQGAFLRYAKSNWEQYHEENVNNEVPSKTVSSTDNEKENQTDPNQVLITHSYEWDKVFQDASRPLVVDVGCGMGVSLLGLSSTTEQLPSSKESSRLLLGENVTWSDCNFVGVDLGALGIEYARGVAHRCNLEDNLHFTIDAAEDFCRHLQSYPGEIRFCMIQFPT